MQRAIRFNRVPLDQTVGVRQTSAGNSELGALMLKLQRVAWEKRTPLALSTLRQALSGKQRPESGGCCMPCRCCRNGGTASWSRWNTGASRAGSTPPPSRCWWPAEQARSTALGGIRLCRATALTTAQIGPERLSALEFSS